jgi:hypothetical protein
VLSRRISIRFDATGKADLPVEARPDMSCVPYVAIGGRRVHFDFTGGNVLCQIDEFRPCERLGSLNDRKEG